ncbi:hypothetical protein AZF37_05740 [endosymbiont 'TC1' of Trimyema compressum]|nr:ComEC/Rec2 family competence protein [endosymbiont 'TC1' of Trimyema compressum]AMP20742.1 hypothetical protein AZF37_05740 [endosymbiont 'TC1' of Trimyema compressum]
MREYKGLIEITDMWDEKETFTYIFLLKDLSLKKAIIYSEKSFEVGEIIDIEGFIDVPKREQNKGGFSQRAYLKGQGINFICTLKKEEIINKKDTIYSWLYNYKMAMKNQISKYLEEDTVLFTSFFLGDKKGLDDGLRELWQNLGISHLLAVSGTHMSLLMDICIFLHLLYQVVALEKELFLLVSCFYIH